MNVYYSLDQSPCTLVMNELEDLAEITETIATRLREEHPELNDNAQLLVTVTDGVLNSLCDDSDDITLGSLDG